MAAPNTDNSTTSSLTRSKDAAIQRICAGHLHQTFWLPATSSHAKLRITYATTSNFSEDLPVALFCAPMFGSRYMALDLDRLANEEGVRIIFPDRPNMGGSTPVPLDSRVSIWLETVPALLEKLGVEHISLMCHSAGTIYALNTLYHLRDLLDPRAPYIGLIAPWVHSAHSDAFLMTLATRLPMGMYDSWHNVNKFINTSIAPALSWSGGAVSAISGLFGGKDDSSATTPAERYGTTKEIGDDIERLEVKYVFAEDTRAADEEAKLCSKRGQPGSWGACEDYEEYVRKVVDMETLRRESYPDQPMLRVQVYFGESDIMIGKGGQAYFEKCWKHEAVDNTVRYDSQELPGTNHDSSFFDQKKGALRTILQEIKRSTSNSK